MGKRNKNLQDIEFSPRLIQHLRAMGIADVATYQSWCADHGFGSGLNKPKKMLAREREHRRALSVKRARAKDRNGRIPLRKCLVDIAAGQSREGLSDNAVVRSFSDLAKLMLDRRHFSQRSSLVHLVRHMQAVRARFVAESYCESSLSDGGISLLESLVLVAAHQDRWIRPLQDWKPKTKNAVRQFQSLLRHLFDQYGEVPVFMDQAWATARSPGGSVDSVARNHRDWYMHIGSGSGLKGIEFPIPMTKKMKSFFLQAPSDVCITQAIRWAQVRGVGGDSRLAESVLATSLGQHLREDRFWVTVIRWFTDYPMLDRAHIGPIVDYLHNQRFVPRQEFGVAVDGQPPEPNLSMRGRSPDTLLRQVDRWHQRLAGTNRIQVENWRSCGIEGIAVPEGSESSEKFRVWTIRELLGTKSLVVEGRKLRHCVATYARSCASGSTSIWTMELESNAGIDKRLTIEVVPKTRTIVQARGKLNRKMTEQERSIVRRWCAVSGLKIARYIE